MDRIANGTQLAAMPAPDAPSGTPGYFGRTADGAPGPTKVGRDFLNRVQEEIMSVILAAGIDPVYDAYNQLLLAIQALIAASAPVRVTSAPMAITGTSVVWPHGLGVKPFSCSVSAICIAVDAPTGYAIGAEIELPATTYTGQAGPPGNGAALVKDAADITYNFSAATSITVAISGGGGNADLNPAKWNFVFRAVK